MAKLSAYGRKVVAKFRKEVPVDKDKDYNARIAQRFVEYALMSNRDIMKKEQVVFEPDKFYPGRPQRHDWGWHKIDKLPAEIGFDQAADNMLARGFELVER